MSRDIAAELDHALAAQAREEASAADAMIAAAITLHRETVKRHGMTDDGQGFSACLQLLESVSEDLLAAAARKCAADHGLAMPEQLTLTVTPEARRDIAKVSLELCLNLIGQRVLERQLEAKAAARRKLP